MLIGYDYSNISLQAPDVSALLEAAVSQQEAQQAAQGGALVTSDPPAVANEEEISNIVHTS